MKLQGHVVVGPLPLLGRGEDDQVRGDVHVTLRHVRGDGWPACPEATQLLTEWLEELAAELEPQEGHHLVQSILRGLRDRIRLSWPKDRLGPAGAFQLQQVRLQPPPPANAVVAAYVVSLPDRSSGG